MKIRLYSYGGSGLKYFTSLLRENTNLDCFDKDHNPHQFCDINKTDIDKQIFIHACPINAHLSFKRRDKQRGGWIKDHMRHLGCSSSLQECLTNLFKKWLDATKNSNGKICMISYEDLLLVENNILEFLNIESLPLQQSFKKRDSNKNNLDPDDLDSLNEKYLELLTIRSQIGPFYS